MDDQQFKPNGSMPGPDSGQWQQYQYTGNPSPEDTQGAGQNPGSEMPDRRTYLKQLRGTAGRCGIILLALGLSAYGLAYGAQFFIKQLADTITFTSGMQDYLLSYLPCLLADFIAILLGITLLRPRFRDGLFNKPQGGGDFSIWGVFGALGAATAGAAIFASFTLLITSLGFTFNLPLMETPNETILEMLLSASYICVLGPICEEIIFRGLILKSLQRFGNMTAIILSSVAFGMFHLNPAQFPTAVMVGLLLGYLTVRTKSIYPAMIAHIVNNTARTLPLYLFPNSMGLISLVSIVIYILGAVGILIFVYRFGRGFTSYLKEEEISIASVGAKIGNACRSVGGILYIIFFIGMITIFFIRFIS